MYHGPSATSENALSTIACTSTQNAAFSVASTTLVRITHPFHPLSGRAFICVGKRFNRYGSWLLLQVRDDTICSVPPHWTDLFATDPEIILGKGRAHFRVADLLELAQFLARLNGRFSVGASDEV
jgi:hypothetical protein